MPNQPVPHYGGGTVGPQRPSAPLRRLARDTDYAVAYEGARALQTAARVEGAAYVGERLMTNLDRLRRHEAQSAADDPVVADEYAAIRRRLLAIGLNEMDEYRRRWP